jgi:hypothetical protein
MQAAPVRTTAASPAFNTQRRRSIFDLEPPPEQRPFKNFPGASQEANQKLNQARGVHSAAVKKVIGVEDEIRKLQEELKKANSDMVALDQLVIIRETFANVKKAVSTGLSHLSRV